jgi:ribose/xylose/arabinose/galactoside ABC-type transport system permease subunit
MQDPFTTGSKLRNIARRIFRNENFTLLIILLAVIGGTAIATRGLSATRANITNLMLQYSTVGVAATGQTFVVLSGGIDLSVGGMGRFAALTGAGLMTTGIHNIIGYPVSPLIALPTMIAVGLGWGLANGSLVARLAIPPVIATLAMWQLTEGISYQLAEGSYITDLPPAIAFWGRGYIAGVPVSGIIWIVVVAIAYLVLHHTTFGRNIYATGGDPASAWISGVNVRRTLALVYLVSGMLAGLVGLLITTRIMSVAVRALEGLNIDSIASVAIGGVSIMGGRGSIIGATIGVLILAVISNGLSIIGATPDQMGITKAAIIIGAVAIDYYRRRR